MFDASTILLATLAAVAGNAVGIFVVGHAVQVASLSLFEAPAGVPRSKVLLI